MNKNKKLMSAGIWLYGLACVAGNQKTEMTTPVASSQIAKSTQLSHQIVSILSSDVENYYYLFIIFHLLTN